MVCISTIDYNFYEGNDWKLLVTVKDKVTGDPEVITGYEFFFTVKNSAEDSDAEAIVKHDQISINGESGEIILHIPNSLTDIISKTYYYDVQMKNTDEEITTLRVGKIKVSQRITDRKE